MKISFTKHNCFEDEVYINLGIYYSKVELGESQVTVFGIGLIFWALQLQYGRDTTTNQG
jgi:hypothetical protein